MYLKCVVDVPTAPPGKLIILLKQRKSVYVYYQVMSKYDPVKKGTVFKRPLIGKLVDPNDPTKMYPNLNYLEYFSKEAAASNTPEIAAIANASDIVKKKAAQLAAAEAEIECKKAEASKLDVETIRQEGIHDGKIAATLEIAERMWLDRVPNNKIKQYTHISDMQIALIAFENEGKR